MKKILYTFFFGYAPFRYRRLIRTPIIIGALISAVAITYKSYSAYKYSIGKSIYYKLPNDENYSKKSLIDYYGQDVFYEVLDDGQITKNDTAKYISTFYLNSDTKVLESDYYKSFTETMSLYYWLLIFLSALTAIPFISFIIEPFFRKKVK